MALTKAVASLDGWTAIAQNTYLIGATADISAAYQTVVAIDAALTSTTAPTNGLVVTIEGSSTTSGDNNWHTITSFPLFAGQAAAVTQNLTNNPANAGTTVLTMASTTGFATWNGTLNNLVYIKDSTIANSEIRTQTAFTSNTNITLETGTTNSHAQNTPVWNTAINVVFQIPDSENRIRIRYNNKADSAGSTVDVRSNIMKITGI